MKKYRLFIFFLALIYIISACGLKAPVESETVSEAAPDPASADIIPPVTEGEDETTDKTVWMDELWPEWEEYAEINGNRKNLSDEYYPYEYHFQYCLTDSNMDMRQVLVEELNCTMYASERQFVYSNDGFLSPINEPLVEPYMGQVVGAVEKGEAVHVLGSIINRYRPQDDIFYVIETDNVEDDAFLSDYLAWAEKEFNMRPEENKAAGFRALGVVCHLQMEPVTDITEEPEAAASNPSVATRLMDTVPAAMEELWSDWQVNAYKDGHFGDDGYYGFYEDGTSLVLRDAMLMHFYPFENFYERVLPQSYEDVSICRKSDENRVMYAAEDQFIYAMILPTKDAPLTYPYLGPVVGFIEKGQAVRVNALVHNKLRPEDGVYYGIAIDDVYDGVYFSEYMDAKLDRFGADVLIKSNVVYGYAARLSENPVQE